MPRIGYVPYSPTLEKPGDRRRFVAYARARNLPFELADPHERYDLVVLSEMADITVWCDYPHGKIAYDLIDSYLSIPHSDIKQWFRGAAWYLAGRYSRLRANYWNAIRNMCRRADATVCTTSEQEALIRRDCQNVHIVLDAHDFVVHQFKEDYRLRDPINIVWEGLPSNIPQLRQIRDVLRNLGKRYPLVLNVVTDFDQPRLLGRLGRVRSADLIREVLDRARLHVWDEVSCSRIIASCDIAVIPIDLSDPFVSGKPENKLLLLWRMGMPVVVSATPAYRRAMQAVGLPDLACNGNAEWTTALESMICDEALRRDAGVRGRSVAESRYGRDVTLAKWDGVFSTLGFDFSPVDDCPCAV
jgi:glycosyltransferase involved in cell wall biosynthesis